MDVIIKSDGTPRNTTITDTNGTPIQGVQKIEIDRRQGVRAQVFLEAISAELPASFRIIDPRSGEWRRVKRIEFDDGNPFEPGG